MTFGTLWLLTKPIYIVQHQVLLFEGYLCGNEYIGLMEACRTRV